MYYTISTCVIYIVEMFIIYSYAKSIFDYKKDMKTALIISFISYGLSLIAFLTLSIPQLNVFIITLAHFIIIKFGFKSSIKTALFNSVALTFLMTITEFITLFISSTLLNKTFANYSAYGLAYTIDVVISKTIFLIFCRIISNIAVKEKDKQQIGRSWYLMIIPATSIVILFVFRLIAEKTYFDDRIKIICTLSTFLLLIGNLIVFFVYESVQKNNQKILQFEIEKNKYIIDETYLSLVERRNDELNVVIHDIKNHLVTINALKEPEEIHDYVNIVYNNYAQYKVSKKTGNKMLDVILDKYKTMSKQMNINFKIDTLTSNLDFMSDEDLSVFLNNLLDNAFEASQNSVDKIVNVSIGVVSNRFHMIDVSNSCFEKPKVKGNRFVTKKEQNISKPHGYGTLSINKISSKYKGISKWDYDESKSLFTFSFAFPIENV